MFSLYELNQLTIKPQEPIKYQRKPKTVDEPTKLRKNSWNRFCEQQEKIQKELEKSSLWKVAIKYGFCHKTLQKYLDEASSESKSQVI